MAADHHLLIGLLALQNGIINLFDQVSFGRTDYHAVYRQHCPFPGMLARATG
jgi:hypothetical protein